MTSHWRKANFYKIISCFALMCILKSLSEEASIPHMVQEGMVTEERCQTADFLFFDDKVDAKKTDNNVVKVKGCLIQVHEDINNLPRFPS